MPLKLSLEQMQDASKKRHRVITEREVVVDKDARAAFLLEMRHMEDVLIADYMEGKRQQRITKKELKAKRAKEIIPILPSPEKIKERNLNYTIQKCKEKIIITHADVPKPPIIRPPAEYSNTSPYGIASELLLQK